MANLSWQLYKGYYSNFKEWGNLKTKDPGKKKEIEIFFKEKNDVFLRFKLQGNTIPDENDILLTTTYPGLLFGSGYAHGAGAIGEFKIGFHLDYTTGLPIIPGSSVKGTIRSVFPQFKPDSKAPWKIKNIDREDETAKAKANYIAGLLSIDVEMPDGIEKWEKVHQVEQAIFEGLDIAASKNKAVFSSIYHRDIFHDAYPVKGNSKQKLFGTDSITPHAKPGVPYEQAMLTNPTPLLFLKVLPEVTYAFKFRYGTTVVHDIDAAKKKILFETILQTFGTGAKTNVGYGQFSEKKKIVPPPPPKHPEIKAGEVYAPPKKPENITAVNKDWPFINDAIKGKFISATVVDYKNGTYTLEPHINGKVSTVKASGKTKVGDVVFVKVKEIISTGSIMYDLKIESKIYTEKPEGE